MYYILDENRNVKACNDPNKWAEWIDGGIDNRRVALDSVGLYRISTVFLGYDHRFREDGGDPVVFETMVFIGTGNEYMRRYTTWDLAMAGHNEIVEAIGQSLNSPDQKIKFESDGKCKDE